MVGFFDSGFGGLTVLREVVKLLPQYSFIYLGDNARTPYGDLDQERIYQFTKEGVVELFKRGAGLVILACNTSSSEALRRIQQEFLPAARQACPEKNVLGIIIPTAEEIENFTSTKKIGILATKATINSLVYPKEIAKVSPTIKVYQQACPLLVPEIESGKIDTPEFDELIREYLDGLFLQSKDIDAVILGCTHYALIESQIKKHLSQRVHLISQGPIIANKLKDYLNRHLEVETRLEKNGSTHSTNSGQAGSPQAGEIIFLSTEASEKVESLASLFYGEPVKIGLAEL